MNSEQKILAVTLLKPNATNIKILDNEDVGCCIDSTYFEVEVYICGDAICFNGFSETPPKGRIQI